MKTYTYILMLGLSVATLSFIAAKAWPTALYEITPIKINFDVNGKTYTHETKMGSAFAAADSVIIGDDLYVKYPHSKPAQYIAMGKVKQNEDGTYTWINDGDKKLSFSFACDVDTTIECITFDGSEQDLAPYKKSWEEVWDLESHDPELKAQINDMIKKKDEVLTGSTPQTETGCSEKKAEVQTEELKKEKYINMLELLEQLNKQPYPTVGSFLQGNPSSVYRSPSGLFYGNYDMNLASDPYFSDLLNKSRMYKYHHEK